MKESSVLCDVEPILFYQAEVSQITREILILKLYFIGEQDLYLVGLAPTSRIFRSKLFLIL